MAQLLRPLRANLGTVAAVGVGAGLVYAYAKPKPPTVFGGFNPQYLRLDSIEQVNHNTKRLRFAFPNPDDLSGLPLTSAVLTFSKPAGHVLPVLRPYTPITHADTPGHLDLLVKLYPAGKQSTHLHSLSPGDSLAFVTAIPGYKWQPSRSPRRIACIAGGAGVTPVWQLVQGILADPEDRTVVDVVYGANSVEDVLLREEWGRLVEKSRGRLRVHYTVSRGGEEGGEFRRGYVTKELLRELGVEGGKKGEGEGASMVFVCGPPKMEEALVGKGRGGGGILAELGFRKEQVYKF